MEVADAAAATNTTERHTPTSANRFSCRQAPTDTRNTIDPTPESAGIFVGLLDAPEGLTALRDLAGRLVEEEPKQPEEPGERDGGDEETEGDGSGG